LPKEDNNLLPHYQEDRNYEPELSIPEYLCDIHSARGGNNYLMEGPLLAYQSMWEV